MADQDTSADTMTVEFDLSWSNAWKDGVNHDAVWIFIKYSTDSGSTWSQATLKSSGTNPSGYDDGTKQSGSAITGLDFVVPEDKVGCVIKPRNSASGLLDFHDVQILWDYAADGLSDSDADASTTRVRVFGTEVVYIPQGDFNLGDGSSSSESSLAFHVTDNTATQITSSLKTSVTVDSNGSDDLDTNPIGIDGDGGIDTDNDGTVDNSQFPTGYGAFYVMKYEISQGQYRDFLNVLTQAEQNNRVAADLSDENDANTYVMVAESQATVTGRQTIKAGSNPSDGQPYTFTCDLDDDDTGNESTDGEWIAMNYLHWMDVAAFCDWSGLRLMTELEYEKMSRGEDAATVGEYAWGTTTNTKATGPTNGGQNSETSTASGNGLANYGTTGVIDGPLRVGFAATSSTNRVQASASFYGVMNLSDNVFDAVVSLGNATGRNYRGTHGDGILEPTSSYEGNATNSDWPGYTSGQGISGGTGSGYRGAAWTTTIAPIPISERTNATTAVTTRGNNYGGRCVRTAP